MKNRKDREVVLHLTSYPKLLILGEKDGVLNYQENSSQIDNTNASLISFPDGHMSPIENREETLNTILEFIKKSKFK